MEEDPFSKGTSWLGLRAPHIAPGLAMSISVGISNITKLLLEVLSQEQLWDRGVWKE